MKKYQLSEELIEKAKKIKLLLMDCDGVLTDGRLYYTDNGEEMKVFNVRDGQGLVNWHRAGFESGIISGRNSNIVKIRATELGMKYVKTGSNDKLKDLEDIISEFKSINKEEIAYVGDDLPDIKVMRVVGFAVAVGDAEPEVISNCSYKTNANGGMGAIREVVEVLMTSKL